MRKPLPWGPYFFFSSRRRHTMFSRDWSSDVCSSDLMAGIAHTLPHVDIFMPNEGEALKIAGDADAAAAARRFRELGARCVIVKRGPDGCLIVDEDGERTVP